MVSACMLVLVGVGTAGPGLAVDPPATSSCAEEVRGLLDADAWIEALETGESCVAEAGADPQAQTAYAEALFRAGRFDDAERRIDGLLATDAPPARALVLKGRLLQFAADDSRARELFDEALARAPEDPHVAYWTAGAARTRDGIIRRLEHFLTLVEDPEGDRVEAARGKIRLYEALGDRPLWVVRQRPERVELPLTAVSDGAGGVNGYTVDVRLSEKTRPVRLLLDTGSTGLFVLERIARKRGFTALAEETVFGGGGDRRHRSQRGLFPTFALGELVFADALATVTPDEIDPIGRFHGLIGLSVFRGYRVELDLDRERLVLTTDSGGGEGDRFWDVGGQLLVRGGTDAGENGLMLFDTGATSSALSAVLAARHRHGSRGDGVDVRGFGGALSGTYRLRGVRVEFQGRSSPQAELNVLDLSVRSRAGGVEVSGLLGLDLLAGQRWVIDLNTRHIEWLAPEPRGRKKKEKKKRGR